ncbi:MAG: hypothetical protein ACE5E6_06945 [Phycisphaerae bacterium]
MATLDFNNTTDLSNTRLRAMCLAGMDGWATGRVTLRIRYSRGADFSGRCYYNDGRIFVNLGRHVVFPYRMGTNIARARAVGRCWYRPVYTIELRTGYELVLFVFMHELYHLLVKRSRRNPRQKESMCDRFATRHLIDRYGARVRCDSGRSIDRGVWDFQDLDAFVAAAQDRRRRRVTPPTRAIGDTAPAGARQLWLFSGAAPAAAAE